MIRVSIITGFLGSGKTTLISRILRDPAFGRTAVIVNEFGEVALDHDLIAAGDDQILTLSSGCLCCAVQSDLAQTLMGLSERREARTAEFDRVLIETSGLSDPLPILQTMMTDVAVSAAFQILAVVTLVDTVHGEQTLHEHAEARHQVAIADRLLFSKTDLQAPPDRLLGHLSLLNQNAPRMTASRVDPAMLFAASPPIWMTVSLGRMEHRAGHGEVQTFMVIRDSPLPALVVTLLLEAVAEHCGSRLLRLKGLVSIEEMAGRPAVIHGVRHVVSTPDFLDRWPSVDERTRIVFITKGVPRYFVSRLLDAIEAEVRAAGAAFG